MLSAAKIKPKDSWVMAIQTDDRRYDQPHTALVCTFLQSMAD